MDTMTALRGFDINEISLRKGSTNFRATSASSLTHTLAGFIGASISGISDAPRGICTEIPGNFRKVVRVLWLSISARHMSASGNHQYQLSSLKSALSSF